jgi:L-fuconolactonase
MKIDAHQHFWKYSPEAYPWISEALAVLKNDFLPNNLLPLLQKNDIDACVAVQASQTEEETLFLLELAAQNDFIKGVVGWVDLRSEQVEERLAALSNAPKLKGIRHIVQDEPDDNFLLRADFQRGISSLKSFNLVYDVLVFPKQLAAAIQFVKAFPNQAFVIDHIAKPYIKAGKIDQWRKDMQAIAQFPNVMCKVSGMLTEADWSNWKASDFHPYLEVIFEAFGVDRIMYGSDWPVCLLAGSYDQVIDLVKNYIKDFSADEKAKIMGSNATSFYNL